MNLRVDEQRLVGVPARRHPVLYLRPAERGGPMRQFAEQVGLRSVHHIVDRPGPSRSDRVGMAASESLLDPWKELESQFMSSSLGVIAEGDYGCDAILQLLLSGQVGGEVPGAIALIGFDDRLPETCLRLADEAACSSDAPQIYEGTANHAARLMPFEWPPLMIFLPATDPDLAACGRACREMRGAGIPIGLEGMDASLGPGSANASLDAIAELVSEVDDHFSTHLAPVFPKLI